MHELNSAISFQISCKIFFSSSCCKRNDSIFQIEGCETNRLIDITSMSELNYDDHCRSGNQKGRRRMFKHVTGMCPLISYNHFMRCLSEVSSWVSMPTHLSGLRITPNNFNSFNLVCCSNTCTSVEANTAADMLLLLLLFLLDFSTTADLSAPSFILCCY